MRILTTVQARLVLAAIAGAGAYGSAVALLGTSAWLISSASLRPPILTLTVAIVAVRTFGIARGMLRYAERLIGHDAAFRMLGALRVQVYRELGRVAPAGLGGLRRGDVLSRVVSDVDAQQDLLLRVLLPAVSTGLVGLATAAVLAGILPAAGLIVLAGLVLAGAGVPALTLGLARRTERQVAPVRGELSASVVELIQCADELVAYGAAEQRLTELDRQDAALTGLLRRSAGVAGVGAGLTVLLGGLMVVAGIAVGVPALRAGTLPGPMLAVVVLTPLALTEVISGLPGAVQQLPGMLRSRQRLRALVGLRSPVIAPAEPVTLPAAPADTGVAAWDLAIRWPEAARPAVSGVDLELGPGQRIAVTGPSGAGKSTVVAALLRFLDPAAGRLEVAGCDVTAADEAAVRSRIAWCGPDGYLFDSTIRANLLLARPDSGEDALWAALREARLADWVSTLPAGLDTAVGEHGAQVSGGERQRIALARALLAGRPVLVLDEPTAHLDELTAGALTADLLRATEGRTTLLVTHRVDDLAGADAVVRIEPPTVQPAGPLR
jgi:thiol reductant ABC exporter CydC subunit